MGKLSLSSLRGIKPVTTGFNDAAISMYRIAAIMNSEIASSPFFASARKVSRNDLEVTVPALIILFKETGVFYLFQIRNATK
ncbi:hypothetical protein EV198_1671 [Roseivirga ehrenbergii]|uniref:Uncharacterized protein n=1 Tax=Roseivirga ehrenbergii (strain DSM 102268 / JCM 13514 / KCTC 12282 / NCIMB 14502 / KMM 6017) TaxID=279360 RepID=A0A150XS28_ROSEK|nr:hypothetical protein MB14_12905 [Roseivirga ehrenbergii]TCL10639.1 hypothetical protein EV198_1671 [Roseivirga ehrenbergii]